MLMTQRLDIEIRPAVRDDFDWIVQSMCDALAPYYGGDHARHAERIFQTHISGGVDHLGFFSTVQMMFIAEYRGSRAGLVHIVGKRQGTMKISPLIVDTRWRQKYGIGTALLKHAENFAFANEYRQLYCTVAQQNSLALDFFLRKGFIVTGRSDSHYKDGITELMLYKPLVSVETLVAFDRDHISVLPFDSEYESQVRQLLLERLPTTFSGICDEWVSRLFEGHKRRDNKDINKKYKIIFIALDRSKQVRGVVGATPKKGSPIKLMPFIATDMPSFIALLRDVPFFLREYGRKLYIHITPSPDETIALQGNGWMLNGAMPAAYHPNAVTQQWSMDVDERKTMRSMRVKDKFLKFIEVGKKDLEVRVGYSSLNSIRVGELINFNNRNRSVIATVVDVRKYNAFAEMLDKEDPERIIPGESKESLLNILRDIYPKDKEKLGVIVLQVDVKK